MSSGLLCDAPMIIMMIVSIVIESNPWRAEDSVSRWMDGCRHGWPYLRSISLQANWHAVSNFHGLETTDAMSF